MPAGVFGIRVKLLELNPMAEREMQMHSAGSQVDQGKVWHCGRLKISNFGWIPTWVVVCFNV
jgi:hypothetical protein